MVEYKIHKDVKKEYDSNGTCINLVPNDNQVELSVIGTKEEIYEIVTFINYVMYKHKKIEKKSNGYEYDEKKHKFECPKVLCNYYSDKEDPKYTREYLAHICIYPDLYDRVMREVERILENYNYKRGRADSVLANVLRNDFVLENMPKIENTWMNSIYKEILHFKLDEIKYNTLAADLINQYNKFHKKRLK